MMKTLVKNLLVTVLIVGSMTAYAKDNNDDNAIDLYKKPNAKSSVAAQIKPSDKLIPIITKDDQWLKAAKASDGTVGWLKREDLEKQQSPQMHQVTITENGDNSKRVIHYQGTQKLSKKQVKQLIKQMRQEQTAAEKRMRRVEQEMDREMRAMESMFNEPFFEPTPDKTVLQPVIIKTGHEDDSHQHAHNNKQQTPNSWWHQLKERMKLQ